MKSKFFTLYKQYNGSNYLKLLFYNRVLLFSLFQLLLLGLNKTSLELLRILIQQKIFIRLKKKFGYLKYEIDKTALLREKKNQSNTIWFCWLQGLENAPIIVIKCFNSIRENISDREIIVLTSRNYNDFINFPDYIIKKWEQGVITNTHFSDLLRIELLLKYGGTWIDATVFLSGKEIPQSFFDSELFVFQKLKPGRDGNSIFISTWFMTSHSNNKIILATRELLFNYWANNNRMIDYYLIHYFFCLACIWYPEEYQKIPKFCNSLPHILQLELFEKFDKNRYEEITQMTSVHKVTYKTNPDMEKLHGTLFEQLFK